ncbi:MAG: M15 family metallopeptidase [Actinomycetota bacterium]
MNLRRHFRSLVAAVAGVALGTGFVVTAETISEESLPPPSRVAPSHSVSAPAPARREPVRTVLLAWTPGGLPRSAERRIEGMAGVRDATTIVAGLEWIRTSHSSDGTKVDAPGDGLAIPFEVAVIEPREYARFVPPAEGTLISSLGDRQMLIAETEEQLRGAGVGLRVTTDIGRRSVAGVVADRTANGYEALVAGPPDPDWQGSDRFVLAHLSAAARPRAIERKIRSLLDTGQRLRVRLQGESPYLRYGDAVLPQLIIKRVFGEFAAKPAAGGSLQIEERWLRRNIRAGPVPIIGDVTCHRRLFGQLRGALTELRAAGLGYLVDPSDYGGCYSARFVGSSAGSRLSHHSWGIAVDVNVAENAFGTKADQDPRVVRVFEDHGFTWGGRWLIPDGMHFEWARFP